MKFTARPAAKPLAAPIAPKPRPDSRNIQLLKGMKDTLPTEQHYWNKLRDKAEKLATYYGYQRIDTPILEMTKLFRRTIGEATDIVEKEMYTFTDLGGESITLRPEGTAGVARAYVEHGMVNQSQPVKFFYIGPMFRHENPQSGRVRQHHQFGMEMIGEASAAVDAEIIFLTYLFYKELGIATTIHINSIGTTECRKEYIKQLVAYFRRHRKHLSPDDQRRLGKNPLRLLDSKTDGMAELIEEAPQIVDWLDDDSKHHFMKVLEYLDAMGVPYVLEPTLVRGLDYYTKTVFEVLPVVKANAEGEIKRQSALCGGGRYDGLIELLGGREQTPACGVGIGLERAILEMKRQEKEPPPPTKPKVFLAQVGEQAKQKAFPLFEEFRKEKLAVGQMFAKDSLKSQLELADKMGARYVLILGQKEVLEDTVLLRDMEGGVQETVSFDKIVNEVKKRLRDLREVKSH